MLKIIPFVVACVLVSPVFAEAPVAAVPTADSAFQSGVAAEKAGDPVAAGKFYSQALQLNPKHANARYSLGQLKINAPNISAKSREEKFGSVMIPVFQLDQATLQEAITALGLIIEKESKGQVTPNFVIEDPKQKLMSQKISLNLKNMPARAVMKYLTDQTGAKARYDEHAIVVFVR